VALALAIPFRARPDEASPLLRIEHELAPWVGFGILPLFGFANAGLSFADLSLSSIVEPIPVGIAAGLFLGKQIGVFGTGVLLIRRGWAQLPDGAGWAGRPLRHQRFDRNRLHDEPLHRHARLWRIRPRNSYAVGRACRLGAVGGCRGRGARLFSTGECVPRLTA
jgi:Na+/H+ antiporter 1